VIGPSDLGVVCVVFGGGRSPKTKTR